MALETEAGGVLWCRPVHSLGILLVENDSSVMEACEILSLWGHRIYWAPSADASIVVAIHHGDDIDMVIASRDLPDDSGLDVVKTLASCLARPVPTVLLIEADLSDDESARAADFKVMKKPITKTDLQCAIGWARSQANRLQPATTRWKR